jgi:hypothetical protein
MFTMAKLLYSSIMSLDWETAHAVADQPSFVQDLTDT